MKNTEFLIHIVLSHDGHFPCAAITIISGSRRKIVCLLLSNPATYRVLDRENGSVLCHSKTLEKEIDIFINCVKHNGLGAAIMRIRVSAEYCKQPSPLRTERHLCSRCQTAASKHRRCPTATRAQLPLATGLGASRRCAAAGKMRNPTRRRYCKSSAAICHRRWSNEKPPATGRAG